MYSSKSHSMEEVSYSLTQLVSMEEVKNAMFAMNPYKGLGPDGFQAFLFQKYQMSLLKMFGSWWPMLMRQVISTLFLLKQLLFLSLRLMGPLTLRSFSLAISLCNVLFKLILKVLVERIRPRLSSIIGPFQN